MNIHEYQAKKILAQYGILIPEGKIAYTPLEAKNAAAEISARGPWMLKAQIQSGAREKGYFLEKRAGKDGGIRLIYHKRDILNQASQMLGATLVTTQTGPKGRVVSRIYVEAYKNVWTKFYIGLVIKRISATLTLLIAPFVSGSQNIVERAEQNPDAVLKIPVDLKKGVHKSQIRSACAFLGLSENYVTGLKKLVTGMLKAFVQTDASMIEINPAGVNRRGQIFALDAKMSFDDNAAFRHPELLKLQDDYEEEDRALKAKKFGFKYNDFDNGNVGCIVNGDGITLAAMDMLKSNGVDMVCALNVKGGVDKDKIAAGIKIIMTNPRVEGILINILGGFLRCNLIAEGIVAAASEVGVNVPLVVRFEGTNKDEAMEILQNSKLPIIIAKTMEESVDMLTSAMKEAM